MESTVHHRLKKSFNWYSDWHEHPHHQHTHWALFTIVSIFLFSLVSGSAVDFYSESRDMATNTAQAQTILPSSCYQGPCPSGYIAIAGANASSADPAETAGWYCDDDQGVSAFNLTYPVQAIIACDNTGVGFVTPDNQWPCNAGRPGNPGWTFEVPNPGTTAVPDPSLSCGQNGGSQCGGTCPGGTYTAMSGPTFDCNPCLKCVAGNVVPMKNGSPVSFIATTSCSGTSAPFTLNDGNITAGAYTTSPSTEGVVCVQGTLLPPTDSRCGGTTPTPTATPIPRYVYYASPFSVQAGQTLILSGQNLGTTVNFYNSSGTLAQTTGVLNTELSEVAVAIPLTLIPGLYTVGVGSNPDSNTVSIEVIAGAYIPGTTSTQAPVIISMNPIVATSGDILQITGTSLTPVVQFSNVNGEITTATGNLSIDEKTTTLTIPSSLIPGIYTVAIVSQYGTAVSSDVLTIISDNTPIAAAAAIPEVPPASNFQDLISNAFNYSLILVGIAVFIMIMWGGFLWLTSAANPGNIATAKRYILNAILGAVLLVSAYVILRTINPELVGGSLALPRISSAPQIPIPSGSPGSGTINACTSCNAYPGNTTSSYQATVQCTGTYIDTRNFTNSSGNPMPIPVNSTRTTCPFIELTTGQKLLQFRQLNTDWMMSEGFPPTVDHLDPCHANGTCLDIALANPPSDTSQLLNQLAAVCNAAIQAGFRILNEYGSLRGIMPAGFICGPIQTYATTTGNNLHLR